MKKRMYISSNDFGYAPRYSSKNQTMGFLTEKDFSNAVRIDYNPNNGKITPKIDLDELKDALIEKAKDEIKKEIQQQILQELGTNIINPAWIAPGLQIAAAVKTSIQLYKTMQQIFDAVFAIYGKKLVDGIFNAIFKLDKIFGYRDEQLTFEQAANYFFNFSIDRTDPKIAVFTEELKKFKSKNIRVPAAIRMLQYYPYYQGTRSKTTIMNQLYPENTNLDSKVREDVAQELGTITSNLIEPAIIGYLMAEKGEPLEDGNIPVYISQEFQNSLNDASNYYKTDDNYNFNYDVFFYTTARPTTSIIISKDSIPDGKVIIPFVKTGKTVAPIETYTAMKQQPSTVVSLSSRFKEFKDKTIYRIEPNKGNLFVFHDNLPSSNDTAVQFENLLFAPDNVREFVKSKNFVKPFDKNPETTSVGQINRRIQPIMLIKRNNDGSLEEIPIHSLEYVKKYNDITTEIALDETKIPTNVYMIVDRRYEKKSVLISGKYVSVVTPKKTISIIGSLGPTITLAENDVAELKVKEKLIFDKALKIFYDSAFDYKAIEPDTFEMAKTMDETTARLFLKAVEDNPYPYKGLSHKFYFNRINKVIEPELAKIRKNKQRITLGVVAALGVGYALLSE
jgi:hypothetical protein